MTFKITAKIALFDLPGFLTPELGQEVYDELMKGGGADLMLEGATVEELDHAYLGNELIHTRHTAMFEAVTTDRMRLAQTMRAFVRALNRGLNGTGIKAGTDDAGIDSDGKQTIGGAIIGKVRRVNNIPIMTALIPLSDGESISLVFHSPTADNGRIKNKDMLVAFRFLLNKRDVTHIVAPIGGRDVSLQQVTQALANLAERNSAKFIKQQAAQAKLRGDIDALNAENDQLGEQQSSLLEQVDTQQEKLVKHQDQAKSLRDKLADQRRINADLESELAQLQNGTQAGDTTGGKTFTDTTRQVKNNLGMDGTATLSNGATISYDVQDVGGDLAGNVRIVEPSGRTFVMPSPSSQGGAMGVTATKLLKAYREGRADRYQVTESEPVQEPVIEPVNEPAADQVVEPVQEPELTPQQGTPEQTPGTYRYALTNRPADIGAVPVDHTAILPAPAQGEKYGRLARHGFIEYDHRLSEQEASNFELRLIPTHADLDAMAERIANGSMGRYAEPYLEMAETDQATFEAQVRLNVKKNEPNIAYPEGDDLTYFMQAMKEALKQSSAPAEENEPKPEQTEEVVVSEADLAANEALDYLDAVMQLQSSDMVEIRDARNKTRGAIAALQNAGRFDENEERVNAAAQHLSDLLVAIQRAGVAAWH